MGTNTKAPPPRYCREPHPHEDHWACSLSPGHAGEHRAHEFDELSRPAKAWGGPAPLDPVLVTLAAAALTGRIIADQIRVANGSMTGPAESDQLAAMAFEDALATRAALREAGEGGTKCA